MDFRRTNLLSLAAIVVLVTACGNGSHNEPTDGGDTQSTRDARADATTDALAMDTPLEDVLDAGSSEDGDVGSDASGGNDAIVGTDAGRDVGSPSDSGSVSDVGPMPDGGIIDIHGDPEMSGCPTGGYRRLVPVTNTAEFDAAIADAMPGDQIRVAAGTYMESGDFRVPAIGTADAYVVICGMPGEWPVFHGSVFHMTGAFITVTGLVFEGPNGMNNNVFMDMVHDINFTGNEIRNGSWHAGIAVETTYNVSITRNFIHDNGLTDIDHGIYYRHQAGRNVVANNVIFNNHGRGISMHDNEGDPIPDAIVVNNTIVRNGNTGILVSVNGASGNVVANNLLYDNGWISDHKQIRILSGVGNIIANNIVWSPNPAHVGIENATTTNMVTGNVESDPLFVGMTDFHLQAGSPAIGLALPEYSPPRDFDDRARDSAPDTGAYEH
jgi:hypothetical protein